MSSESTCGSRWPMTPSLSDTFEPPRTTAYGRSGFSVSRSSTSSSACDERAGGARQQLRELVDAGLLAVHDAEAVGHERVAERGELLGEGLALRLVLRGLPRVEPEVLEQGDVAVLQPVDGVLRAGADGVAARRSPACPAARRAAGRPAPGCTSHPGAPSGRPEVGDHDHLRALSDQGVQGGNRRSHATVVRDRPCRRAARSDHSGRRHACRRANRVSRECGASRRFPVVRGARPRTRSGRPDGWSSPTRCRTSSRA